MTNDLTIKFKQINLNKEWMLKENQSIFFIWKDLLRERKLEWTIESTCKNHYKILEVDNSGTTVNTFNVENTIVTPEIDETLPPESKNIIFYYFIT